MKSILKRERERDPTKERTDIMRAKEVLNAVNDVVIRFSDRIEIGI